MKVKTLQWRWVLRTTLFILMISFVGMTKANAYNEDETNSTCERDVMFDFVVPCPPGNQNMYYKIIDNTLHYVRLTHPNDENDRPWHNFTEPTGNLNLPETVTYNGTTYTVTEIGSYTFNKCYSLTGAIVIPNTVTIIRQNAFSYCNGISSLTIGNSVTKIEQSAFAYCLSLSGTLSIPSNVVEIGQWAFQYCSSFNALELSEGLLKIGSSAFQYCSGFTGSLIIPNSVNAMSQWAFAYCSGFNGDLKLSDNLTLVPQYCFKECTGFTGDLIIPKNITKISNQAFYNCNNFNAIYICTNSVPLKGSNNDSFYGISNNIPIYVPNCLLSDYNSQWSAFQFTNYQGRSFFNTDGNWSNEDNWACGSVPTSMDVVIAANCDLDESVSLPSFTILNGYSLSVMPEMVLSCTTITNKGTAENLIIQDGGQLYHNNANVQATVMKSITAYDSQSNGWYLIAPPLVGNTPFASVENLLSNDYDLFYYDEPTYYWFNQKYTANNFINLESGTGYLYANSEDVVLGFAGALKAGNVSMTISPLSYQGAHLKGFNLVGNPYAHNVTSYTTVNVNGDGCYRMNSTKDDLMVSEISVNSPLKPAEGFFVLATNAQASITFSNQNRSEVKRTGSVYVELVENGLTTDRLIVKRSEEDQNLAKLSLRDNRTKLFASKDNQELAIVVSDGNEQPVNFKTNKNGNYTINVSVNDLDLDYLHLIDNLTGEDVDLLATPSYSFDARITDYASRFRLVFEPNANEENNDSFAFISDDSFIIANEGTATLQVIDMTGRILSSETIYDSFTKPINLSDGVYVLRLINGDNVKTQKIVVR